MSQLRKSAILLGIGGSQDAVVLAGLRLIPLPFVGTVIAAVTAIFGLGAIILGPRRLRAQPATFPRY
jgi:hypothetical protein